MTMKKIICVLLSAAMLFALAGCSENDDDVKTNNDNVVQETESSTEQESSTEAETTTEVETTTEPETTTEATTKAPDGEAIKEVVNTLEKGVFYMAGTMNLTSGESMETKITSDGTNTRVEIVSKQMKMTIIYLDNKAYLVNNSTNYYAVLDETAFDSFEQIFSSMSMYGVSFTNQDISELKSMMENFDETFDYSQYIEGGVYDEFYAKVDGVEYLCSRYGTDYGKVYIYTQDGALKIMDVYDTDGLRQMNFVISAFIPQVLTPITLTGYNKAASVLDLFTGSMY